MLREQVPFPRVRIARQDEGVDAQGHVSAQLREDLFGITDYRCAASRARPRDAGPEVVLDVAFVAGGFAEVTPERCTVLADDAMPVEEIDRAEIERMLPDLRDDVAAARDDAERDAAARALATAEAKLAVLSSPTY